MVNGGRARPDHTAFPPSLRASPPAPKPTAPPTMNRITSETIEETGPPSGVSPGWAGTPLSGVVCLPRDSRGPTLSFGVSQRQNRHDDPEERLASCLVGRHHGHPAH